MDVHDSPTRFNEFEQLGLDTSRLLENPEWCYQYAAQLMKGRWPEAEPAIVEDPEWAYHYAKDAIKGRWPEAEPYIMKNPRAG